jgi:hypothetical protein
VGARAITSAIRALTDERDLSVGIVACLQTHGSRANWHPHLHLLVTDGGFRPDGTFVSWGGVRFLAAPLDDIIRSKEATGRAKDEDDVLILRALKRLVK